ncbi:hypothetical protein FACS1894188_12890 [Clostridia bacterium]|nr:hypothetical protein FACS1894188_12890 [Clostridia bacterium]
MPNEDVIFDMSHTTDENKKYELTPVILNSGELSFSGTTLETTGNNLSLALPGDTVTVNVSEVDLVNNDFYGVIVTNRISGVECDDTRRVEYAKSPDGNYSYKGFEAKGGVGLEAKLGILGKTNFKFAEYLGEDDFRVGASASVYINTFTGDIIFEGEFDFKIISADGKSG